MSTPIKLNTFIEPLYMKTYELVDENVDDNKIVSVILSAQRLYIRPIIGKRLYQEIALQIINAGGLNPLTADNSILLNDYIAPCLGKYVMMELRPTTTHQLTNKGSQTKTGEFAQPDGDETIKWLMDKDLIKAGIFGKDLIEFLCENRETYPLYCPREPYKGGLYTGPALDYNGGYVNGRKYGGYGRRTNRLL